MPRRWLLDLIVVLSLGFSCTAADRQTVLLAATRNGWIDAIDPDSFQTLGRLSIGVPVEGVAVMPDGRTLLVTKSREFNSKGCCGLFILDLATATLAPLLDIAQVAVPTADGGKIFTQRGNIGIEVFDGRTFARRPTIHAPGFYHLQPSSDGRWLFGTSNGPHASLDIFDLAQSKLVRHLELRYDLPRSAWVNGQFLLYALDGNVGKLWAVTPETAELGVGVTVPLPNIVSECGLAAQIPIGIDGRLFLYEAFGHKLDRRNRCGQAVPGGGVFEIDPASGAVLSHLEPGMHFSRLVPGDEGRTLYAIDIAASDWRSPRLVKFDSKSGAVLAEQTLQDGVWSLIIADIPKQLVPRQTLQVAAP